MSSRTVVRALHHGLFVVLVLALCASQVSPAQAGFRRGSAVGGVIILVDGVVRDALPDQVGALVKFRRGEIKPPSPEMNQAVEIRKISLKALEAACQRALAEDSGRLPDEIRYLGGLQRVQYVLVYPELNDIVLAGPAEGWKVDNAGNIVGVTTGRPVLQLDDLLIALRTINNARQGGLSCSIEPTEEGYRNLNALLKRQRRTKGRLNIPVLEQAMKQAFGPQQIKLTGVPATSHFARVLVAADYRMKRLAMKLDPPPVADFPSYVDLLKKTRAKSNNMNPRWWMACNYDSLLKSADGLAWQLRGQGVKCLTEDEVISRQGTVKGTGRTSPAAEQWANLMTEKFDELAAKELIFTELRNSMDLSVVAALIDQHGLLDRAGCSLPLLTSNGSDLMTAFWFAPKTVPPQCSFLRVGKAVIVTASGGVQINPFDVVMSTRVNNDIQQVRTQATGKNASTWWWN